MTAICADLAGPAGAAAAFGFVTFIFRARADGRAVLAGVIATPAVAWRSVRPVGRAARVAFSVAPPASGVAKIAASRVGRSRTLLANSAESFVA
jgi:hypothetical protein